MSERFQSPGGRSNQPERREPGQREPASTDRWNNESSREMQRAAVRRRAFDQMQEGDEGQGEWESSARSNNQ